MSEPQPSRNTVGIRDVAHLAGVSAATASRSLRVNSTVPPATRDRVLTAARELGYSVPRATERLPSIGVLARFPSRWFFAEAVAAVERAVSAADHRMVLYNVGDPTARHRFFERVLPLGQLDGIVVVASSFDARERRALTGARVPLVVVGGHLPRQPTVGIDDAEAARAATEHLIGLGHRDIGLLSFDPADPDGADTTIARTRGFEAALRENQLTLRPEWVIPAAGSRMAGGSRAAELLLTRPRLPTALVAMSDELAIGALRAVRRARLTVPGHLSIVGFDDHEMAEYVELTTIAQPVAEQATAAARLLLDPSPEQTVDKLQLPVRLVVRGTTGPPSGY